MLSCLKADCVQEAEKVMVIPDKMMMTTETASLTELSESHKVLRLL